MKAIKRLLGYCLAASIPLGFSAMAIVFVSEPVRANNQSDCFLGREGIGYSDYVNEAYDNKKIVKATGGSSNEVSQSLSDQIFHYKRLIRGMYPFAEFYTTHNRNIEHITKNKQNYMGQLDIVYSDSLRNLWFGSPEQTKIPSIANAKGTAQISESQTQDLFAAIEVVVEDLYRLESSVTSLTAPEEGLNMAALNPTIDSVSSMRGSLSALIAELNRLPKDGSPEQLVALANMLENAENAVTTLEEITQIVSELSEAVAIVR